eukprot:PITA_21770
MKCLSFNCRGMASASKKLALRRLFEVEPTDIIMLQETLGEAEIITNTLASLLPGWQFFTIDATGRSGGLATGLNPRTIRVLASWGGPGFIGLDFFSMKLGLKLRVINTYGRCHQRENFWKHLINLSIVSPDHIILGVDLNFSICFGESWGSQAQVGSITGFMTNLLEQHNLVDIPMNKPLPTWRNRRVGEATLARRLDRFFIKVPLMNQLHHYKQWVGSGGVSDHSSIYLEVFGPHPKAKGLISTVDKAHLIELENRKERILKEGEESWRLRSRAIWLQAADENTRFFQNYAKGRKVSNTVWNLPLPDRGVADTFNKLSHLGTSHFK